MSTPHSQEARNVFGSSVVQRVWTGLKLGHGQLQEPLERGMHAQHTVESETLSKQGTHRNSAAAQR